MKIWIKLMLIALLIFVYAPLSFARVGLRRTQRGESRDFNDVNDW